MLRLFILIPLLTAAAATSGAVTLPLDRVADYAVAHNPSLAAARLRIDEARGRVLGAGRLANPDLEFDYTQNARMPERTFGVAFTQRFPVTARLRMEKAVTKAQLAAAEAEVRDEGRRLAAGARAAAVKMAALRAQRELRAEQLTNTREQAESVSRRFKAGEASAVEVAQFDLETRQLEVELLSLNTARAALTGELRTLLGVPADEAVEISGALASPGTAPAKGATGKGRADLEAARHKADAAKQAVGLAKANKWQDIGAGVTASNERTEDAPNGYSHDWFVGLKFTVPLPLWNKNEGQIAEAAATSARAEKEASALAFNIRNEAEAARAEMAVLARLVAEMDDTLLPQAARVEEHLRASYVTGQTPLTEVLRARSKKLEIAQRRLDALRDYHLALVRYDAAVGRNTPGRGKAGK